MGPSPPQICTSLGSHATYSCRSLVELAIKSLLKSRKSTIGFLQKSVFWKPHFWVFENCLILVRAFYFDFFLFQRLIFEKIGLVFFYVSPKYMFSKVLVVYLRENDLYTPKEKSRFFWTPLTSKNKLVRHWIPVFAITNQFLFCLFVLFNLWIEISKK